MKGLLEEPNVAPNTKRVDYKIFIHGKEGVGKTSFVKYLQKCEIIENDTNRTSGVHINELHHIMSPAKESVVFKLQLWDAGYQTTVNYPHILKDCLNNADAFILLYSFNDKSSFYELSEILQAFLKDSNFDWQPIIICIGTKSDVISEIAISSRQVTELKQSLKCPVFRISCVDGDTNTRSEFLDYLCQELWKRDQSFLSQRGSRSVQ